jgi:hypothetical protein
MIVPRAFVTVISYSIVTELVTAATEYLLTTEWQHCALPSRLHRRRSPVTGQTFLLRIRDLVPFVDPVDDDNMPNTDPYEAV